MKQKLMVNLGASGGSSGGGSSAKIYAYRFKLTFSNPTGYTKVSGADGGGDANEILILYSSDGDLNITSYAQLCNYIKSHFVGTTTAYNMPVFKYPEYGITKLQKDIDGVTHKYFVAKRTLIFNSSSFVQTFLIDAETGTQSNETTGSVTLSYLGKFEF